jgi:hypothetical protein
MTWLDLGIIPGAKIAKDERGVFWQIPETSLARGVWAESLAKQLERDNEMTTPTLDEVLELAKRLTIADQQRLVRLLNPPKTIEQLAEEQGVGPFNWDRAAERARRIWPEEDSIDDFLAFLEESRKDRGPESRID